MNSGFILGSAHEVLRMKLRLPVVRSGSWTQDTWRFIVRYDCVALFWAWSTGLGFQRLILDERAG